MNQTKFDTETKGSGRIFLREKTSNFIKGLGAFLAIVLINISIIIIITIVISERSLEISVLLSYLYVSAIFLLCYSLLTTKTVNPSILYKIQQIIKRFFDVVIASYGLFFLMPVLILLAIAIKIDSAGPILFRSKRVGQFGILFDIYRFRTMYIEPKEKTVTKVGNFLRRYSLNSLPMLINVVNGELSLIGPWPRSSKFIEISLDKDKKILIVRPGLSGLWQISNTTSFQQEIELDLNYIENWSLLLDAKIIIKTVIVLFTKNHNRA